MDTPVAAAPPLAPGETAAATARALSPTLAAIVVGLATAALALAAQPRVLERLSPSTGDEPFYLMTAGALWQDHRINEARQWQIEAWRRFYPQEPRSTAFAGWPAYPEPLPPHASLTIRPADELYSKHGLGVPLLIAPAYGLAGRAGALTLYAALAGLLAGGIYLLAWETARSRRAALLVWAALSLSTPLLSYALVIFPALPAALLIVYAVRTLLRWEGAGILRRLLAGAALGFLPWLHTLFALLTLPLCAAMLARTLGFLGPTPEVKSGSSWPGGGAQPRCQGHAVAGLLKRWAWLLPPLVAGGLLAAYHQFLYGMPWPNFQDHAGFNLPDFSSPEALLESLGAMLAGLAGVALDSQWGLFFAAPVYLAAAAGLLVMARRRAPGLWVFALVLPYCVAVSLYRQWWGEWCPPARYLAPVAPLASAPLAFLIGAAPRYGGVAFVALLAIPGLLLTALYLGDPHLMFQHPSRQSVVAAAIMANVPALSAVRVMDLLPSFLPQYPYVPHSPFPLLRDLIWTLGAAAFVAAAARWATSSRR